MTTTFDISTAPIADLLAHLNDLRHANGKKPLSSWKNSRVELELRIQQETPAPAAPTPTPDIDAAGIDQLVNAVNDTDFKEGELIYDVDGNEYAVTGGKAVLNGSMTKVSYFLGPKMKQAFTRTKPIPVTKVDATAPELTKPAKRKAAIDNLVNKAVTTDTPTTVVDVKKAAKAAKRDTLKEGISKAFKNAKPDTINKSAKVTTPKPTKTSTPQGKGDFAKYLESIGMEPRVARAKLRRAKIAKVDGRYEVTDALKAALKADGRKKQ